MTIQLGGGDVKVKVEVDSTPQSTEVAPSNEGRIELNSEYWKTKAGRLRIWQIVRENLKFVIYLICNSTAISTDNWSADCVLLQL